MQITALDVVGERIPMADSFPVSYESHSDTEHVFVRLGTDDGAVGYGEGTALPWFTGEVTEGMAAVVERYLEPRTVGASVDAASTALTSFLDAFPNAAGATAAVELALLDLRGKRAGVPVHELLGPTVRDEIDVTHILPAIDPDAAVERALAAADDGFRSFKVKADGDVDSDVDRVNALLAALPEDARLRVDANTGWRRFGTALEAVERIERSERLEYVEQPVARDRPEDMRRLWDQTGVPVYADESVNGPGDVERFGAEGTVAGCHLKLAKTGSLVRLAEMQRSAQRHGLTVTPVSAFGTSLEGAAIAHLAATAPNVSLGTELCTGLLDRDPVTPAFEEAPTVDVPTGPGLGVELSDDVFE
jgi:o-succinylbenzoate synthase